MLRIPRLWIRFPARCATGRPARARVAMLHGRARRHVARPVVQRARQAGGDLRVERVQRQHLIGPERVARAVRVVHAAGVVQAELEHQRAGAVRVAQGEGGMRHQLARVLHRGRAGRGLQREPLVDHQRVVPPLVVEGGQRLLRIVALAVVDQRGQRGHAVGHVVGRRVLLFGQALGVLVAGGHQVRQRQVLQRALAGGSGAGCIRPASGWRRRRRGIRRPTGGPVLRAGSRGHRQRRGSTAAMRSASVFPRAGPARGRGTRRRSRDRSAARARRR